MTTQREDIPDGPYKLAVTGPECSGKSTLARALASHLNGTLVPELSRALLTLTSNQYVQSDLDRMLDEQIFAEEVAAGVTQNYLVLDTSVLVYYVWSLFGFGEVSPHIKECWQDSRADLYILCKPLSQYEADPLRTNRDDREELYELYRQCLTDTKRPFVEVPDQNLTARIALVEAQIKDHFIL